MSSLPANSDLKCDQLECEVGPGCTGDARGTTVCPKGTFGCCGDTTRCCISAVWFGGTSGCTGDWGGKGGPPSAIVINLN